MRASSFRQTSQPTSGPRASLRQEADRRELDSRMELATYFDEKEKTLALSDDERAKHLYVIGRSGSGKSTLLYNLAVSDILAGHGVTVIDPHGDLFESIIDTIPPQRTNDVALLDVTDEYIFPFNPLSERTALAADNLISAFKAIWHHSWGPRLEWFLHRGVSLLMEKNRTLIDLPRLYYDKTFRAKITEHIKDPALRDFWHREYPSYNARYREDAMGPILNKVGQFLANPLVRQMLSHHHPPFTISTALQKSQIFLINLSKGHVGEEPANLLGSLILSNIKTAVMARKNPPMRLYVDEFQSFGTTVFASMLSEARKYNLALTLAHQFTAQIDDEVRSAILGNAGTMFVFRVGVEDARLIAGEFHPLPAHELADQFPFHAWVKRGANLDTIHVRTKPPQPPFSGRADVVRKAARMQFCRGRT